MSLLLVDIKLKVYWCLYYSLTFPFVVAYYHCCCILPPGTADWHHLRRFSFTSSQAHHAFVAAIPPAFRLKSHWRKVVAHLFGEMEFMEKLNLLSIASDTGDEDEMNREQRVDNDENQNSSRFPSLDEFVRNFDRTILTSETQSEKSA